MRAGGKARGPRGTGAGPRDRQVHVFLSEAEKEGVAVMADVKGLSVSSYVRELILADAARYYTSGPLRASVSTSSSRQEQLAS